MKKNILFLSTVILAGLLTSSCRHKTKSWIYPDTATYFKSFDTRTLSIGQLTNIIFSEDTIHFRLIDVRTPHQYQNGHLLHTVNVPLRDMANPDYYNILNQDKVINVFYGEDASQARLAGMIISHYGLKNNVAALGGYKFIKNHMLNRFGIYSANYNDEKPEFDYAKIIAETVGAGSSSISSAGAPPLPKPIAHKKKKPGSGGCD